MSTLLIVDDEQTLLNLVATHLCNNHYQVVTATTGFEALKIAYQSRPDLAILDIKLPDLNGIKLCRRLRDITDIPILMLTAVADEKMVVKALDAGADDYIVKPFGMGELLVRVKACLRRVQVKSQTRATLVTVGDITIDFPRRQVSVKGEPVMLTPTEFNLLTCLAEHQGEVISYRGLLQEVWGPDHLDQVEYLRTYIGHLRKKIEPDTTEPRILLNKRGVGYYLAATSDMCEAVP